MTHDPLTGKTVVILGFARQGQAVARWLNAIGATIVVSDKRKFGDLVEVAMEFSDIPIQYTLGGHPLDLLYDCDALCLSGGVDPTIPVCIAAQERGIPLTNDAQLFLERCSAPVIGITGSAGKTTTTTLVGKMVAKLNPKTWIGGNIGEPLLDKVHHMRPDHRVVMELSSFQLELMTQSPHIAAILNITPNHLDRHGTMEAYIAAKAQIFAHQNDDDVCVLNYDDPVTHTLGENLPGQIVWFSLHEMVSDGAFLAGNRLMVVGRGSPDRQPHVVCVRDDIKLRGEHNVSNVLAACAIAGAVGVPIEAMREVIREFMGVAHRLEIVRTVGGVTYVNDSIATAPERVVAALRSFDEPLILLAGGRDKKLPWSEMATLAAQRLKYLVTFGEHGATIAQYVRAARLFGGGLQDIYVCATLEEAVKQASELAQPGDVVLLSPGGTSYDAYTDFQERGEHFRALVLALAEKDENTRR
ncbi:MAG TPA: UDP-N-acetylmuramoyl-L-alanine--D-glutamate ligase [Aggregatilineales bacterium]|nr:UDP-N-acetylmuramoyl-L-alanine--D-glutamate ligase [Anaerolineales bacterium]HRE46352.1 UDP-N-acetylmuramoyl-L-alanine--D-glutamate ligase [Aggregatilineales bacterium]